MTTLSERLANPGAPQPAGAVDRRALGRLLAVVAGVIVLAFLAGVGETVLLVGALLLCIVLHEFGHFITAKWAGMKVTEFFVGFGPRLWSVQRGETEYGVKALPLGGYCRIIGMSNLEEVEPADEPRTYRQKPVARRLSVALAGSAMHFLIAIVVLFSMFFFVGDDGNYLPASAVPASARITNIDALTTGASPATEAGLRPGDRILAVDGRRYGSWQALTAAIDAKAGVAVELTVLRGSQTLTLHATPIDRATAHLAAAPDTSLVDPSTPKGFLGIEADQTVRPGLGASLSDAGGAWVHVSALTIHALGRLVTFHGVSSYVSMLGSQKAADSTSTSSVRFASPVKVVQLFHQAGQSGLPSVLWLLAVINLSLGIFNLIPLLPLDGGHVVIAAYEGVRSRLQGRRYQADVTKLLPLFYVALVAIVFLGASALFLDIRDLVA